MTRQDIRDIVNKTTAYSFMGRKVARTRWSNVLCNGRKPKFVQPRIPTARTSSTLYTN